MNNPHSTLIENAMVIATNPTAAIPKGIPGKLFVIPFVFALIVLCVLMIAVAFRFQSIMVRLEVSRSLWPAASQELGPRYKRINESILGALKGDAKEMDLASSMREFNGSTQFDRQANASMVIENQITRALKGLDHSDAPMFDADLRLPGISKLIDAERRRRESQSDFIGWLTVRALRLKLPNIYDPQATNQ